MLEVELIISFHP